MPKRAAPCRLNALVVALMTKAMVDGPSTSDDLMEASGLTRPTVARYLRALRKVQAVYIAQWEQDSLGRFVRPAFVIGPGRNAARPKTNRIQESRRNRYRLRKQMAVNDVLSRVAA